MFLILICWGHWSFLQRINLELTLPHTSRANPNQLEAILATDGPVLIIVGPGSGKTFTLVERIVYLITEKDVKPESLLVVTFTDKAARELTTRISSRLADLNIQFNLNEMYLVTFHSICLRLLENFRELTRLKRSFNLFDQQYFLFQHIKNFCTLPYAQLVMGDDQTGRWAQSESLLKWLNKVSEEGLEQLRWRRPQSRRSVPCPPALPGTRSCCMSTTRWTSPASGTKRSSSWKSAPTCWCNCATS